MNQGKYVFSQVMTYFPRWVFEVSVEKYNGDFHAKNLNSYSHCLHLMFGQIKISISYLFPVVSAGFFVLFSWRGYSSPTKAPH